MEESESETICEYMDYTLVDEWNENSGTPEPDPVKVIRKGHWLCKSIGLDTLLVELERSENGEISIYLNDPAERYVCGLEIDFDTCQNTMDMLAVVENISSTPRPFYGAYLGRSPRE